jgi:arsenate reductase
VEILRGRGVEFDAIEYLKRPLDRPTLVRVLSLLASPPAELVRKDKRFQELGLRAEDYVSGDQVVALLLEHPELMQRPIVIRGDQAIIARPGEKVLELLGG